MRRIRCMYTLVSSSYKDVPYLDVESWKEIRIEPMKIFTTIKICDYHFELNYISTGHHIILTAVPTLYLEDKPTKYDTTLRIRSCYKTMRENLNFN
ncbi:unnamed protein product [Parnassius mnemosyne]|uniref:THAP-type domain-containing protein n=1 Tax=Parnassius mnemosyne TaxID=213953 RepID=A0AAV1LQ24_9NEOP